MLEKELERKRNILAIKVSLNVENGLFTKNSIWAFLVCLFSLFINWRTYPGRNFGDFKITAD